MTFSGKLIIRIGLYLLLLAVPGIVHAEFFNEVYDVVKKAIDTGEDAVDTANRALDTIDEFKDIAKDVPDLISTTAKVYRAWNALRSRGGFDGDMVLLRHFIPKGFKPTVLIQAAQCQYGVYAFRVPALSTS